MTKINERIFILIAGTISGFSVMLVEICGVRLLGPYFGTSIIVWTNILSVILVALSAGSLYGGKIQKKDPGKNLASKIFVYAGISIIFIPILSDIISGLIFSLFYRNPILLVFLGSLISSMLIFGLPFFILGMISPYLVSYLNHKYPNQNNTGHLISLSTLGGLFGTILPTVLVIPLLGTKFCVVAAGLILFVIGSINHFSTRSIAVVILFITLTNFQPRTYSREILQIESREQYIKIYNIGNIKYLSFESGLGIQSIYNPDSILTGTYYDYVNVLPEFVTPKKPLKVLILGLAGGTTARELIHYYGDDVEIVGVENDPEVIYLARKYMGLPESVKTVGQDGRLFLASTQEKYDVIYIDAFTNEFQIPWHITTKEFWQLVSEHLNKDGIVGMNILSLKKNGGDVLGSIAITAKEIFPYVYSLPISETENQNLLLLISNNKLSLNNLPNISTNKDILRINQEVAKNISEVKKSEGYRILTDDSAPIELLTFFDLIK